MKFLEEENLQTLTHFLTDAVYGSRVINGRVEAFSCKRVSNEKRYANSLEERYNSEIKTFSNKELVKKRMAPRKKDSSESYLSSSPLGNFNESSTRRLLTDLILTLNASFPDFDFGSVKATDFRKLSSRQVADECNQRLAEFTRETRRPWFRSDLWKVIDASINLSACEIFTYVHNDVGPDFLSVLTEGSANICSEQALWSFNYLFVNKNQKKIIVFTCVESYLVEHEFNDVEDQENEVTFEMDTDIDFDIIAN